MIVAIVQNDAIEQIGELSVLFSNVSFPVTGPEPEWMAEQGIAPVTYFKPYDQAAEKLVSVDPYLEAGEVYAVKVEPLAEDEIAARVESQWAKVRADLNQRLIDCDYTDTHSAPIRMGEELYTAWATYRQALRDITEQSDPSNIVWPEKPQ
jgi:hypothetical protein